ncbi:MAG TPA: long-chain fatty acid--CoA ligase, partial [Chitinophagales bacterium]|nr:long-chain fatty acid--CoA ligase [Chitinophagales bacterium]
MKDYTRLFDIIHYQNANYPQPDAFGYKANGEWKKVSTQEVVDTGNKVSLSLLKLGVKPQDKIAVVANNRPEWNMVDLGILQTGAVNVPVYPTISEHEYKFIFNDAEIKYVFVSDKNLADKIAHIKSEVSSLIDIFTFDKVAGFKSFSDFLEIGAGGDMGDVEKLKASVDPATLATIIYTSGTTGNPKGVMLSHNNIVSNIKAVLPVLPLKETMRVLSFLPLCHIFERVVVYVYMVKGVSVYYAESMETIADNLKEVKPNFFTSVPRLLEKVYIKLQGAAASLDGWKKSLYNNALEFAQNYDVEKEYGLADKLKHKLYDALIYKKWREALGGECQGICTGAAALNPLLARVFTCAGIPIMEGYGQTESSPVISINPFAIDRIKFGTVGIPIAGVEVKLDHRTGMAEGEGEIWAKGPNVMMGYYKRPDVTAETVENGWLKTGDVGRFVEYKGNKYIKITDRVKELFKTSGGKYIAPQQIENKMKEIPYIEQIMAVGENRNFVSALIVPNYLNLSEWATKNGVAAKSRGELIKNAEVQKLFRDAIDDKNKNFGQWETVKKFELMENEWSIEGGELTPTMKVKRKVVLDKYKDTIEKIYSN